jgi:electron transport complex protein RnfG
VRKDGGDFDQFTGATVTPRAVVGAVRNALLYFDTHRAELLAAPAAAPASSSDAGR